MDFYTTIKEQFLDIVRRHQLDEHEITIISSTLTPEEAIGITERQDFPLLLGKEMLIDAHFHNAHGQAFTDQPSSFKGRLSEVMALDLTQNNNRALFIASMNAVLRHLGLAEGTVHCRNHEPELCARHMLEYMQDHHPGARIGLVGLQPAILDNLRQGFQVRVLDLNPDNIGKCKYGVIIEDGATELPAVTEWADIMLVTGSTVNNGTILDFIGGSKTVYFFGTTISGVARLQSLKRLCFYSG